MDPISHGILGAAISSFSGTPTGITNPLTVGCVIGAMMPDIDVVVKLFKDDYHYLKHHRGITHSVPVIVIMSAVVSFFINLFFGYGDFLSIFIWTFIGGISHTVFDILNSYGAQLYKKKRKLNLLTLYDPVILIGALYLIITRKHGFYDLAMTSLIIGYYLLLKILSKERAKEKLKEYFSSQYDVVSVRVMPSLKMPHKWDFVMKTRTHSIVGRISFLGNDIKLISKFKNCDKFINEVFAATKLGEYFTDFTPNYHIASTYNRLDNTVELKVTDLRYHFRNNYMHHATLVLDSDYNVIEAFFRPYKFSKMISVA